MKEKNTFPSLYRIQENALEIVAKDTRHKKKKKINKLNWKIKNLIFL